VSEWNPVSVEKAVLEVVNDIAKGVAVASEAYERYLTCNRDYEQAYARAYMRYEGAAHAKRYAAELDTEQERMARDAADVVYRLAERSNKAAEKKLDALRSIGASVRQAYQDAGRGEW
jgi:hypothetical protein